MIDSGRSWVDMGLNGNSILLDLLTKVLKAKRDCSGTNGERVKIIYTSNPDLERHRS